MATQKFTHLSSKYMVVPLGTLTMNGSIGNAHVIALTEQIDKAMLVLKDAVLTGNMTVTVAGSTVANGTSGFTTIKTHVFIRAVRTTLQLKSTAKKSPLLKTRRPSPTTALKCGFCLWCSA